MNNEAFDRSIIEYASSTTSILKFRLSRDAPRLYNLMRPILSKGLGIFYYNIFPIFLDQFNGLQRIIIRKSKVGIEDSSHKIVTFLEMIEGEYNVPIKFGRLSEKKSKRKWI